MIGTFVAAFVRQRLASPMRTVLATMFFGFGLLPVLLTGSLEALGRSSQNLFAFVFAAGLIGQDVSSGVLTLAFARPVRRTDYVLARWLAAAGLAAACVVLQVLAAVVLATLRHGEVTAVAVAAKALGGVLAVGGTCAVLLMFSALAPGLADLGLYVVGLVAAGIVSAVGGARGIGALVRAGDEMGRFLDASLDAAPLLGQGAVSWFEVASYLSTLTLCLFVAMWAVNRRELSYAAG